MQSVFRKDCLDHALSAPERHGIWVALRPTRGTSPVQRQAVRLISLIIDLPDEFVNRWVRFVHVLDNLRIQLDKYWLNFRLELTTRR